MIMPGLYKQYIIAIASGASLTLSFAPFNCWPISLLALAILLLLYKNTTRPFLLGFNFGLGFFATSVSWIFVSIHEYGNTHALLALLITSLFILLLALFPAFNLTLISRNRLPLAISFPIGWTLCEILRSFVLTGFPWVLLGYSHINSPLRYYAPLIGVYGISLLVALSATLIYLAISNKKKALISCSYLIAIFCIGQLLSTKNWTTPSQSHLASIIQSNLEPLDKFNLSDPIQAATTNYLTTTLDNLPSDIVIWPENSLALPLPYALPFIKHLDEYASTHKLALFLGMPILATENSYYNSMVAVGTASGSYHKYKLVPFGDYVPFSRILRGLIGFFDLPMSTFIAGSSKQSPLTFATTNILPLICYDLAYSSYVSTKMQHSPIDVLIAISEDGWFGHSLGPHQHHDMARMRALETGRYLLRATTRGISAIIDTKGNAITTPMFTKAVLRGNYTDHTGNTPWVKLGITPIAVILSLLFLAGYVRIRSSNKHM